MDLGTRHAKEAIEIAKILCANPNTCLGVSEDSALYVAAFIKTLTKSLYEEQGD